MPPFKEAHENPYQEQADEPYQPEEPPYHQEESTYKEDESPYLVAESPYPDDEYPYLEQEYNAVPPHHIMPQSHPTKVQLRDGVKKSGTFGWCPPQSGLPLHPPTPLVVVIVPLFCGKFCFAKTG